MAVVKTYPIPKRVSGVDFLQTVRESFPTSDFTMKPRYQSQQTHAL